MALPNKGGFRPGGGGFNRGRFAPRKEAEHRINHHIRVPQVRLVGDNVTVGVYSTQEAMKMAQEQQLDLVEISPQADPPVCKIIDYNKFLYDKKKKEKEKKTKARLSILLCDLCDLCGSIQIHAQPIPPERNPARSLVTASCDGCIRADEQTFCHRRAD